MKTWSISSLGNVVVIILMLSSMGIKIQTIEDLNEEQIVWIQCSQEQANQIHKRGYFICEQ
jgi:hypothetical protein